MSVKSLYIAGLAGLLTIGSVSTHAQSKESQLESITNINISYNVLDSLNLESVDNALDLVNNQKTKYDVSKNDLVQMLSGVAERDEFQVAYLTEKQVLVNLTNYSAINKSTLNTKMIKKIISSGEKFYLIHNHNGLDLDSRVTERTSLYWLVPSQTDIFQYMFVLSKDVNFIYGIISKHGLLTMKTDKEITNQMNNPFFGQQIDSEVNHIQSFLENVAIDSLPSRMDKYRGIMSLSFQKAE